MTRLNDIHFKRCGRKRSLTLHVLFEFLKFFRELNNNEDFILFLLKKTNPANIRKGTKSAKAHGLAQITINSFENPDAIFEQLHDTF